MSWDWDLVRRLMPRLLDGLWITLLATGGGMLLALALGLVFALLRRGRSPWLCWPVAGAVEFIRSTPLLIQLFFVFFLVPDLGWNTPLLTGVFVLGLHYATYTSEVYRAGIDAVPRGQWEAARALNLTPARTWVRVVLPQAIPPIVPALGNYLVAMLKDTPLLYAITVREMLARVQNYGSRVGSYVEGYTMLGLMFLALSLLAAALFRYLEKRWALREA